MKRSPGATFRQWLGACLVLLASSFLLHAQLGNQGSIEGTIADPTGAAIGGVPVWVRNVATLGTYSTISNEAGLFGFPVLPVGTYELTAEHAGFATLLLKDLVVTVGARINLPLQLQIAGTSKSVTVSGAAPLLETTRSEMSTSVDARSIENLPVNGRDFIQFVLLAPGVNVDARGGLSFGGQRAMNSLLVDGTNFNGSYFGQPLGGEGFILGAAGQTGYDFSLEVVQEFQVRSNAYSAELGQAAGGVVNAVTKYGTNQFHGTAFWLYRDKSLNANDLINEQNGLPRSPFHFNQFGGVLGGPILRNKLFFFFGYDGLRSNTPNAVVLNLPPSFRLDPDPVVAAFQQQALDYLRPRANSWTVPLVQNDFLTKVDWQASPGQRLGLRWSRQRISSTLSAGNPQNSLEHTDFDSIFTDTIASSWTSVISTSATNAAQVSYLTSDSPFRAHSVPPEALISEAGQLVLAVGRPAGRPQEIDERRWQATDTLSLLRGRQSLKFGFDAQIDPITYFNAQNFSGSFRFLSLESFGRNLSGMPAPQFGEFFRQAFSGLATSGSTTHPDIQQYAGFVQDEWRANPRLTLNLGLRYDVQVIARPPVKNPSPALAAAGLDTSVLRTDKNNFAPRLGLAWSLLRSGRLVGRIGYGIFYAPTPSLLTARAHFQNGISVQTRTFFAGTSSGALIPAYPSTICGPLDPSGTPPSCLAPSQGGGPPLLILFPSDYRQPYTQHASFGFEFGAAKDVAASLSYMFVQGSHLQRLRDVNLGTPTTTAMIGIAGTNTVLNYQQFILPQPIAGFDRVFLIESAGSSIYHGLAIQVRKRFSHNFQLLGSYTLSKVIDDNPNVYANPGPTDSALLSDASNPRADRSASVNDQRHRFVLSGIWELNYADRLARAAGAVLSGWELSGILTAQTGQPYSGVVSFDLNNDRNAANDRTPGLGRNTFYLPATASLDLRLTRNVPLTEHARLQLIGEAFNSLNRANVIGVQTTQFAYSTSTRDCGVAGVPCLVPPPSAFGTPTATSGPRILQLGAKLIF